MTAYRFRVKFDPDPTSLWRDVVVGSDRTLEEFQTTINTALGLDRGHLWFIGTDEDYWRSDVKYQCPQEFEEMSSSEPMRFDEETHNAGETTVGDMVEQLGLDDRDRICYGGARRKPRPLGRGGCQLYDYGDEWRFYAILKEIIGDRIDDTTPEIDEARGDGIEQYDPGR
ncbi:plasmid pRiA4b ORF-3 family protein [Natronococcus sp. JC468]|uniref:plasmid pRiA4b ORF-3 family protein n=1 Tax=Natronococcus sp. JC468 TaxID=1961921 RepID=UPI00143ADCAD|nr:plasmid pRiA4b ORF-3 family protein [Natronococcus sp. JC468]NKE36672.1 plasmid pRiA4b ORF-3 family protein [Natronococcus sp. JC468]